MRRPNFFLRTKLMPPRAVSDLLPRPRLTDKLRSNLQSPMTLVAADAGCGKTTLIADFVRELKRPFVWYQLDHTDADPTVFLGYITQGIKNLSPDFGETLTEYVAEANEELLQFPETAADLLTNEILQSIEQPFIVVLDDYHHIGRDTVVHRIVDRLLQYSSDLVHLIITARDLPPLAMMRRRTQSSAAVITRDDLLFTDQEMKDLFRSTLGQDLDSREIDEYHERTHGWITALQLVRQVAEQEIKLGHRDTSIDLLEILKRSEKDIFDYFAEEVFAGEPESTQKLLLSISILETLPLDICSLLFPDLRCSALLPELAQKNVFLTVTGDGRAGEEYRLHPLFRDFLLRRLRSDIGKAGITAERNRIAGRLLQEGLWENALGFLIDAENYAEAARLLAMHGGELISAGAFVTLETYSKRVPIEQLKLYPDALLHVAEIARLQGNTDSAFELLSSARKSFKAAGQPAGEAEALHSLASIERRRRNVAKALKDLDAAEKLAPKESETQLKCANTRGLCLINDGKWTEAEQQFRYALELAEQQGNRHYQRLVMHNLALGPGFRGDFGEALRWFRRIFNDEEGSKQLPQEAIGHLNVARLHIYRGEFDDANRHLERSLELCQRFNMRHVRPEIFEAYANYYRDIGDDAHAEEYYERAAKAYEEAEIDFSTKELNEERAKFLMRRGDTTRARGLLESLLDARRDRSSPLSIKTVELGLAQLDLIDKRYDGLAKRVEELREYFHAAGHHYDEALAAMLLAETLAATNRENEAIPHLMRVLDLSARFDYDFWLRREMRRAADLFSIDDIAERLPADLRIELSEIPKTTPASGKASAVTFDSAVTASIVDLTVKVLGPVDIFRDVSKPFAADAWTTKRSRDIFCYIATSKHRRVAKDVLIDAFWSDEDVASVEKNFHPTISHIRKALNSRQAFKQNFLVFRDGAYQLNPEMSYSIDCEDFERHIAEADIAKREKATDRLRTHLETAHALYRGEFMPGVWDDWAVQRRQYYTEQFARVVAALANLSFAEKKWSIAQKFANEILNDDPYREDMHRLIMKSFAAQGKPAAVQKQFEGLRSLLKNDLGIEPSPKTLLVLEELVK